MSALKKLQSRKAAIVAESRGIMDKATAEGFQLSDEQKARIEANEKEVKDLVAMIEREEQIQAWERDNAKAVVDSNVAAAEAEKAKPKADDSLADKYPAHYSKNNALRAFKNDNDGHKQAYAVGQWFRASFLGDARAAQWVRDNQDVIGPQAVMSGSVNTQGGILVPSVLSNVIIDLRETYGVFRQNVRSVPMSSDSIVMPRRTGGLTAYFVADTDATTESTKSFDGVELRAKEVAALTRYPMSLAEDAIINLADDLANELAYAFALKEDQCGFVGDGTSTYGGIYGAAVKINNGSYAGSISTAASGHTGFETLTVSDFAGAVAKLPDFARPGAKWYVSSAGFATSMQSLMYAAGGNTVDNVAGGTSRSFLGYPVVISQVLNSTLGADVSKIKVLFGDLGLAAKMGSRKEIEVMADRSRFFEYRQIAIQGVERFDINVHDLGDASNAGPLVALKTPAS